MLDALLIPEGWLIGLKDLATLLMLTKLRLLNKLLHKRGRKAQSQQQKQLQRLPPQIQPLELIVYLTPILLPP